MANNPGSAYETYQALAPSSKKAKTVPLLLDFSSQSTFAFDFSELEQNQHFEFAQAVYIDNSLNPSKLEITLAVTGQKIICPSFSVGVFPVIHSGFLKAVASTGVGVQVMTNWLNVPQPYFVYSVS